VVFFVYSLIKKPEQDKADREIVVDAPDDASAEA
jgi:hypothetical protein